MNTLYPLAVGLVVAALSLSACGGTSSAAEASPTATSASPTPSPTPNATTAQFASILAEQEKTWRDYEEGILDCAMAQIGTAPIDKVKFTACGYNVQTVTITAQTAARDIRKLPAPPAEVSKLVERTLITLDALAKSEAKTVCADAKSAGCDAAITKANGDIRSVTSVLDAWKPYL